MLESAADEVPPMATASPKVMAKKSKSAQTLYFV